MPASWTEQAIVDNLIGSGVSWSGSTITFSFPASLPSWAAGWSEAAGFSGLSTAQKEAAREAIGLWDDLVAPQFVETTGITDIEMANSTTGVSYAHAYYPGGWSGAGSVWLNPAYNSGTNDLVTPERGDWGFQAYMHELGHALGLSHPGNYNGGSPTYANDALYEQDTIMYTIMSYFTANNTGADWQASNGQTYYAQTPMLHDILAIQALYGADTGTRTGNTTYGFNSNAGRAVFDFTQNAHPVLAIWDSSGNDTLDLSGFNTSSRIDLNPGTYSDADAMTSNIAIAFNCDIENAIGGSAADNITGNALDNRLEGNGGNDILFGAGGNDILLGGAGADQMDGGAGLNSVDYRNDTAVTINFSTGVNGGSAAGDSFTSIERFFGSDTGDDVFVGAQGRNIFHGRGGEDTIDGGNGGDTLNGGAGDDVLRGGNGNDTLKGGDGIDKLTGGDGSDTFVFSSIDDFGTGAGKDKIIDFEAGVDIIDISSVDAVLGGGDNAFLLTAGNGTAEFSGPSTPIFGELRYYQNAANTICEADVDGDGNADFQFVIKGHVALDASDFIL